MRSRPAACDPLRGGQLFSSIVGGTPTDVVVVTRCGTVVVDRGAVVVAGGRAVVVVTRGAVVVDLGAAVVVVADGLAVVVVAVPRGAVVVVDPPGTEVDVDGGVVLVVACCCVVVVVRGVVRTTVVVVTVVVVAQYEYWSHPPPAPSAPATAVTSILAEPNANRWRMWSIGRRTRALASVGSEVSNEMHWFEMPMSELARSGSGLGSLQFDHTVFVAAALSRLIATKRFTFVDTPLRSPGVGRIISVAYTADESATDWYCARLPRLMPRSIA